MTTAEQHNDRLSTSQGNGEARTWKILRIMGWCGAALFLLFPLIAMQFTDEVNWTIGDFLAAALILGGTGMAFELALRRSNDDSYRTGVVIALAAVFLLIWSNAAVGFVGAGANYANILYFAMVLVPILGSILAGFKAHEMAITMVVTAVVQAMIAAFAFATDLVSEEESFLIITITAVFIALWITSALLFRQAARRDATRSDSVSHRNTSPGNSNVLLLLSGLTLSIGAILMTFMIAVEGEPGALPLLLVLLGSIGSFFAYRDRNRKNSR